MRCDALTSTPRRPLLFLNRGAATVATDVCTGRPGTDHDNNWIEPQRRLVLAGHAGLAHEDEGRHRAVPERHVAIH